MSWTQGQPNRVDQSPFIDPIRDGKGHQGYAKQGDRRNDRNGRQNSNPNSRSNQPMERVAATFTQEGLQTFSQIFSTSVEAAISKTLPDLVERAVENQMKDFVRLVADELERRFSNVSQLVVPVTTEPSVEQSEMEEDLEERPEQAVASEPVEVDESTAKKSRRTTRVAKSEPANHRLATELDMVIDALKAEGRPLKAEELRVLASGVKWGSNPSVKLSNLVIKSNGQIERVGRGTYQYKG